MPVVYNTEPTALPSLSVLDAVNLIRDQGNERVAGVLEAIQNGVNSLSAALSGAAEGRFDQLYVTDSQTGEVYAKIGSFEQLSGLATIRLWVGGNVDNPENTAPFYVDDNGKLQIVLGDSDDAAALEVLDAGGNTVVWAGVRNGAYGLAAENIWIGPGADPDTAPFFCNGADVVIGENGAVFVRNTRGEDKGFLGVLVEAPKPIVSAANNGSGLVRIRVNSHGWESGDTADVTAPGVVSGSFGILVVDANYVDLIGSTFTGSYSGGGTAYRYYGGVWSETAAHGGTGFDDALFRVFADSSLRIGSATGPRLEVSSDGNLGLTDSSIFVSGNDGTADFELTISPSGVTVEDTTNNILTKLSSGGISVIDLNTGNYKSFLSPTLIEIANGSTGALASWSWGSGAPVHTITDASGVTTIFMSGVNGRITAKELQLTATPLALTYGGTGATTASGARSAISVYSKAEIDALLANKADIVHSHTGTISSVGDHTHGGAVGPDGGHSHSITIS